MNDEPTKDIPGRGPLNLSKSGSASSTPTGSTPTSVGRDNSPLPTPARRLPVRIGTVVWGLLVAVAGILLIVARQANLVLDPGQVLIWLLLGAGLALLTGGVLRAARRK